MRDRAYRRFQRQLSNERARQRVVANWSRFFGENWIERHVRFAETPQRCSCRACGNQRQHEGPPVRERRASDVDEFDAELVDGDRIE